MGQLLRRAQVKYADCPECKAKPGQYCINKKGRIILNTHKARKEKYREFITIKYPTK